MFPQPERPYKHLTTSIHLTHYPHDQRSPKIHLTVEPRDAVLTLPRDGQNSERYGDDETSGGM